MNNKRKDNKKCRIEKSSLERGIAMFRVAICDADESFCVMLSNYIKEFLEHRRINYEIDCYTSPQELLSHGFLQYHLFCLDVEIKEKMDGLALGKQIRRKLALSDIVYISNHKEVAYQAFEVNAFRYLLKPVKSEVLFRTLELILKRREDRTRRLLILCQGQRRLQLFYESIIYFETLDRKLKVHTTQKAYIVDNKINDMDEQLSCYRFFRVHKSYLINLAYVKEHDQTTVTMLNGDVVYISRLKLKAFKENFLAYLDEEYKRETS